MRIPLLFIWLALLPVCNIQAQETDSSLLLQSRRYSAVGDYDNALLLLKKVHEAAPSNMAVASEYVMLCYFRHDYATALKVGEPLLTLPAADAVLYQTMAGVYEGIGQDKKMVATYESGLARFPGAGKLYAALGAHYASRRKPQEAIAIWEKGIEKAPSISDNYYYALKYYSTQKPDLLKVILYAENFILIERMSNRTAEAREILLTAMGNFFNRPPAPAQTDFGTQVAAGLYNYRDLLKNGYTAENYSQLRKEFIAAWYRKGLDKKYPYDLFRYHQQLIGLQLFDAYNQWLLAATPKSLGRYQEEQKTSWEAFQNWFRKDIYKVSNAQLL